MEYLGKRKTIHGLITVAGLSSRMGDFKPLMPLRGKTVIENTIDSMLVAGVGKIVLVLGHRGKELEKYLKSRYLGDTLIYVYNYKYAKTDMLTSIKIGLKSLPVCDAFFLLPGDMPVIEKETYLKIYEAMPFGQGGVIFPTLEGYRKHPPLIDIGFIPKILEYQGEGGLREIWKEYKNKIHTVAIEDPGCWVDIDTYKEYLKCKENYEEKNNTCENY